MSKSAKDVKAVETSRLCPEITKAANEPKATVKGTADQLVVSEIHDAIRERLFPSLELFASNGCE